MLNGVDLALKPGEIVALVGPSGAGKSTLLHVAGLLERPDGGAVLIDGPRLRQPLRRAPHLAAPPRARLCLSVPPSAAGILGARKRHAAADDRRGRARARRARRPRHCWSGSGSPSASAIARRGSRAASSSASRSSARSPTTPRSSSPTSRPATSTTRRRRASWRLIEIVRASGLAALIATHNLELAAPPRPHRRAGGWAAADGGVVARESPGARLVITASGIGTVRAELLACRLGADSPAVACNAASVFAEPPLGLRLTLPLRGSRSHLACRREGRGEALTGSSPMLGISYNEIAMPLADFVHLRTHSAYSLSAGAIKIKELVALCRAEAMPAVAITDSGNLFGALEFATACAEAGIQPIIGCEIALAAARSRTRHEWQRPAPRQWRRSPTASCCWCRARRAIATCCVSRAMPFSTARPAPSRRWRSADLAAVNEGLICLAGGAGRPARAAARRRPGRGGRSAARRAEGRCFPGGSISS